ncbi:MAG TPA: 3D domain-containing protein [Candidatus Baltobacteraceae bacterium]|nr:3D domain-containing protein [Candidatus Baltobacteraceae bacterium]
MIGRVLCAAVLVSALTLCPAVAATDTASFTQVTWHRDGVLTWGRVERHTVAPHTIHRLDTRRDPGTSKTVSAGHPGLVEMRVLYAQRDGGPVHRKVVSQEVLRKAQPRIIVDGIGRGPLALFASHGIMRMTAIAANAIATMRMIATGYTANCAGCGGMTAIGRRAGYGIVAVDPRLIPLGTRLYIPGYGIAIAGDTGGDIVGYRIDLGFDSTRDALMFGRRDITVYRLK